MFLRTVAVLSVTVSAAGGGVLAPVCRADYTHVRAVSLEWLTDSSHAVVVVDPVEDGERVDQGWPMRIVRILKPDPRVEVGQIRHVLPWKGSTKHRGILFLRENDDGDLTTHETCGRDLLRYYRDADKITLIGFDREGRFVQSLDHAISIVASRVKRGPNMPDPDDYEQTTGYAAEPFVGGFYRMAERGFRDFDYVVLVPADPDFRPLIELRSGLRISGYIRSGTYEKNYPRQPEPLSSRPLDGPEAASTCSISNQVDSSPRGASRAPPCGFRESTLGPISF